MKRNFFPLKNFLLKKIQWIGRMRVLTTLSERFLSDAEIFSLNVTNYLKTFVFFDKKVSPQTIMFDKFKAVLTTMTIFFRQRKSITFRSRSEKQQDINFFFKKSHFPKKILCAREKHFSQPRRKFFDERLMIFRSSSAN